MRALLLRLTVGVVMAGALACGGGSSSPAPTGPSPAPGTNTTTITIVRQDGARSFNPNPASLGGELVVFRNDDTIVHRVLLNDGSVDTGDIAPGATSRAIRMPAAGTNYHCPLHPSMVGSVSPSGGGTPPPCQGQYC